LSAARARYGASGAYPALPPGRHLLSRDYVDDYQRRRLVVAVAELAHEHGLACVTVAALVRRARMSRKTVYDYFANRDDCVDYASEQAAGYLFQPLPGTGGGRSAEERLAGGVAALLGAIEAEPLLTELALVHAPALGGERGWRFQDTAIAGIAELLAIEDGSTARGPEMIASAILGVIGCRLRRSEGQRIADLAGEVLDLATLARPRADRS
jgi:AcrR family transcriptional regulator